MSTEPVSRRSGGGGLAGDPRWELVQRVAASPQFQKSSRLRDFLLYVCERSLHGQTEGLTEQRIGCAVFDKREDYSPADDNLVRVQARQLRFRLEEYFNGPGREEPLVLRIPKGTYVPVFHARMTAPAEPAPARWRITAKDIGAGAAICVLAALSVTLWWQNRQPRPLPAAPEASWVLASVFDRGRTTALVIPDSTFGLMQGLILKQLSLKDYLRPDYPGSVVALEKGDPERSRWLSIMSTRPYTTFSDVVIAARLAALAEKQGWSAAPRFSRDLKSRDLNEGNCILLGSSLSNPWVSLFEGELNFQAGWNSQAAVPYFRNREPRPGEAAQYMATSGNGIPGEAYAVVSLLMDRSGEKGKKVLILEGVNMEGTEAAWDFVADPAACRKLLDWKGVKAPGSEPHYRLEVLLHTKALAGAARDTTVVAARSASRG